MNPIYKIIKSSYRNSLDFARSNNPQMVKEYKTFYEASLNHPSMAKLLKKEAGREYNYVCVDKWCLEMSKDKVKEPIIIISDSIKAMVRLFKLRYFDKEISTLNKKFNETYNNLYPNTKKIRKKIINEGRILSDAIKKKGKYL